MAANTPFVHLSLHTEYSLLDSTIRIDALMEAVRAAGMPAVALTDQSNLFALVKFYKEALKLGIKPLIGVDLRIAEGVQSEPSRLLLLCQNEQGYRNLTELVSRGYLQGQRNGVPQVERNWLESLNGGLIALSGGVRGDIGRALIAQRRQEAESALDYWRALFGDRFYVELSRTGREHEETYISAVLPLAERLRVPVVATNDVRFIGEGEFEAHEARVCIAEGRTLDDPRRPRRYSPQQYLRAPAEMAQLFADIPQALENAVEIAKRCNLVLRMDKPFLPNFPVPPGETIDSFFSGECRRGLEQRLQELQAKGEAWSEERIRRYRERLETEIEVIVKMGFPGYFLIVADFIRWARGNDVPVGPGRGSGAGSLAAYALGITDLDPIQYDLLFERFLNPERVSLPDFDVDFCMEGRDRVIEYVAEKYGRDKVSQIITYGSMAAKAVVRDVGRVLGHPYGFVDNIAKLIPFEIGMTLDKAMEDSEELRKMYESEEEVTALIDMAKALEGLARNAGKHAGGVVIAPSKLTDFTPLYCEQDGQSLVTQLDKDDVEAIGLVKFDFLGLRTLTIIDRAVKAVNAGRRGRGEEPIDINSISMTDRKTFDLLKAQATTAVFQLESRGMKDLIKRLQPDSFDDIIALVALFRPGPLQSGMVDDFINCKHGKAQIHYAHPLLEPVLKSTYGIILYQEQVMQIARELAGYTLGEADLLRRAMGKKKPEEMAKQREIFVGGAVKNNISSQTATYIFDLMEKFAGYGFNKSHSAAYALLSYQTAWLKAHYPSEFMASVLSADMDNTDKVVRLIDECNDRGLKVVPPDINVSGYAFTVDADGRIVYGLGAIKGLGAAAIDAIVTERQSGGFYKDLFDFCRRIDTHKLNRRAQEALIRAGAMDSLNCTRATLMANLEAALKLAEQDQSNRSSGQTDIFGMAVAQEPAAEIKLEKLPEWGEAERLAAEKETLGLYLSGHPIDRYRGELMQMTGKRLSDQIDAFESRKTSGAGGKYSQEQDVLVAGLVTGLRVKNTRSGKMAFVVLDDRSARVDVMVRPEDYQKYSSLIARDRLLVVQGGMGLDDFSGGYRIRARQLYDLDQARAAFGKGLEIGVGASARGNGFLDHLDAALKAHRNGRCPVWVHYQGEAACTRLRLGQDWRVQPCEQLLEKLRGIVGYEGVRVLY
jgi:DNA polymerase III subunit alpha